jgi:fimbrial chaperone protein
MPRLLVLLALGCANLSWFAAGAAHASGVKVAPISLTLSSSAPSGTFVLTNQGTELVRFHITAFAWSDSPEGEMVLTPTAEIVFFPAMMSLTPGEARKVRVGINVKPAPAERSFRVFVQELPRMVKSTDDQSSKVSMLTKMGIPIYFEGTTRKAVPGISNLAVSGTSVKFRLTNRGTKHYRADKIVVTATDNANAIHSLEPKGWYVLAGGTRPYVVDLPRTVCATLKSVQVELQSDQGAAKAVLANARCGP